MGVRIVNEGIRKAGAMLCDRVKNMFVSGQCDMLTLEDMDMLFSVFDPERYITLDDAIKRLGISRSKFYGLKEAGLVPEPVKIKGIAAPVYSTREIEEAARNLEKMGDSAAHLAVVNARALKKQDERKKLIAKLNRTKDVDE